MFAYCLNNPVNAVDYSGTIAILDDIAIWGTISVVALVVLVAPTTQQLIYGAVEATYNIGAYLIQGIADIFTANKPVNLPSWKKLKVDMDHILSGHTPNGSRNPDGNKSVFLGMTAQQIYKAIQEAYNNSSKLQTQGDRILVQGFSYTYNLLIEIWVNIETKIIETAYPVG